MTDANRVEISGRLLESEALRYTPAGIPIVRFSIKHESEQYEAGELRKVDCEIGVLAVEREARLVASAPLGAELEIAGFLSRKNRNSSQLILHATHIEFKNRD